MRVLLLRLGCGTVAAELKLPARGVDSLGPRNKLCESTESNKSGSEASLSAALRKEEDLVSPGVAGAILGGPFGVTSCFGAATWALRTPGKGGKGGLLGVLVQSARRA